MLDKAKILILAAGCSRRLSHLTRDSPKSFLYVGDKRIIDYHLDTLSSYGFEEITIVLGYLKEKFISEIGTEYKGTKINYIVSDNYDTTGHSWSLFLARDLWSEKDSSIVLIHADLLCDPMVIVNMINNNHSNVISVSSKAKYISEGDFVVTGTNNEVVSIEKGISIEDANIQGVYVGASKFSNEFMQKFEIFLKDFFISKGKEQNYEIPLNLFISQSNIVLNYEKTELPWKNINYEADYNDAINYILPKIHGASNG